jgi:hypothetical protein
MIDGLQADLQAVRMRAMIFSIPYNADMADTYLS